MKRVVLVAALVLAVAGSAYGLAQTEVPVRLGLVQPRDAHARLYGNIDIRQVELGFRLSGRLAELSFEEGQTVRAGAPLARLDDRPFQDAVRLAEAEVARRTAALSKLEAGSRPAEIAQARARVREVQADMARARQDYERQQALVRQGASPEVQREHAEAALQMASARVQSADEALTLSRQGARVEDIAEARAALSAAEASLAAADTSRQDSVLHAPSDGVILSRVRETGAIVGPSDVVYVLSLTKPVWARAYVSESLLGRIHPGMEVSVYTDAEPGRPYRGRIGFISPVAEFTPKSVETPELRTDLVYRLRVIIEDEGQGLRQDMPVTVVLPLATQAS